MGTVDRLQIMWDQQFQFMNLLKEKRNFPSFPVDLQEKSGQKVIKSIAQDCMHELFEAIHLLKNSKNHRLTNVQEFDRDSFLEELVDALHYFIEICIISGISLNELCDAFLKKGDINTERINKGY